MHASPIPHTESGVISSVCIFFIYCPTSKSLWSRLKSIFFKSGEVKFPPSRRLKSTWRHSKSKSGRTRTTLGRVTPRSKGESGEPVGDELREWDVISRVLCARLTERDRKFDQCVIKKLIIINRSDSNIVYALARRQIVRFSRLAASTHRPYRYWAEPTDN